MIRKSESYKNQVSEDPWAESSPTYGSQPSNEFAASFDDYQRNTNW